MPLDTTVRSAPDGAWTAPRDAQLRRLRHDGATWSRIACTLGVSADAARERGRRIGVPRLPRLPRTPAPPRDDPNRAPLPAGHPRSWGLLTAGTLLAGTGWPGWA